MKMVYTRRKFLIGMSTAGSITLSGCGGNSTSSGAGCETEFVQREDSNVFNGPHAHAEDSEIVHLRLRVNSDAVDQSNTDILLVYNTEDKLEYQVPIPPEQSRKTEGSDEMYSVRLGKRPIHGRYRIVAENASGDTVDEVTVDFHCPATDEE